MTVSNIRGSRRTFRIFAMLPRYPEMLDRATIEQTLKTEGIVCNMRTVQRDLREIAEQPYIPIRVETIQGTRYYGRFD